MCSFHASLHSGEERDCQLGARSPWNPGSVSAIYLSANTVAAAETWGVLLKSLDSSLCLQVLTVLQKAGWKPGCLHFFYYPLCHIKLEISFLLSSV